VGRLFCCRDGTQDSRAEASEPIGFLERDADETKKKRKTADHRGSRSNGLFCAPSQVASMKVLYCDKCGDLFKLTRHELRECQCTGNKVKGKYRPNGKHAEVSENAVSIKIHNRSLKEGIRRMRRLKQDRPKSTDQDYQIFSAIAAWVRPNFGPGNPRTHRLKQSAKKGTTT
jgi:hypothetical protein